jgi:hypothetical protein
VGAAAGQRRRGIPRRRAGELAGEGLGGAPGVTSGRLWSWGKPVARAMHTCAQSSGLGFETACVAAVAGVHGGASPANGVLGVLGLRIHKN